MANENRSHLIGPFRRAEDIAAGAISPGHLIEKDSSGEVQVHSTQGGYAMPMVAEIDNLQGNTLDDDYAADDRVFYNIEQTGSVCQMLLLVGQNAAWWDELISNGDGTLIVNGQEDSGVTVDHIVAFANEAADHTVSGAVTALIEVIIF